MDQEERDSRRMSNRQELNHRRSSVVSLDRYSDNRSREPSINRKHTMIQVMSLQGSEMEQDIYEQMLFEERRKSLLRNSRNSNFQNGDNEIQQEEPIVVGRRSSNNRNQGHQCACDGICLGDHCPCFSEPNQMCLNWNCCPTCVSAKIQLMKQSILPKMGCSCKNSKCLKSYCKCYQSGKKCDRNLCKCQGCENNTANIFKTALEKKNQKIKAVKKPIKPNVFCSCKKSHCLKKYCPCHASGQSCRSKCICKNCNNKVDSDEDYEEREEQRQRYSRIDSENEQDIEQYFNKENYDQLDLPQSMQFEHPDMKQSYDNWQ